MILDLLRFWADFRNVFKQEASMGAEKRRYVTLAVAIVPCIH